MTYKFAVQSEIYGREWFTGYETKTDAILAMNRIKSNVQNLDDGILRFYSDIYEEDVEFDEDEEI